MVRQGGRNFPVRTAAFLGGAATVAVRDWRRRSKAATLARTARASQVVVVPKTRTRTKTRMMTQTRRRRGEVELGIGEYSRQNVRIGRVPRRTLQAAWRVLDANKSSQTWYHNAYSQMFGTQGNVLLQNTSTTATTGVLTAPCHLYDMTANPNVQGTTINNPDISWIPTFTDQSTTGGLLNWIQQSRQWQLSDTDTAPTAFETYPGGECMLDYIQAKMLFYCPTSFPCKFNIQVVQFNDDRFVPGENGVALGIAPNQFNVQTSFWKSMVKKYMHSPLEDGEGKFQKYVKVLYQNEFILNPKETTEVTNTTFRQVNLFMRLNRSCKYSWNDDANMVMTTTGTPTNNSTNIELTVHPRRRIFLMIRAMARNGTVYSNTIHPSYDLVLKKKTSQLAS